MSVSPAPGAGVPRMTARSWSVLFVLCGAIFLEGIDVSMMGVALPSIRAELDLSTADLQWVVTAYVLGYGGFVLLGGRAADLLGRRRMFVTWLVVFIAFSGLGGLATQGWMLVLARFATGVAAGFLTPAGLSIITTTYAEGAQRDRALLIYAGTAAGGFSLGMVTGGLLTAVHWRWVFFAPVVVAAVLLVAGLRLLPREGSPAGGRFDVAGAATLTVGMLTLVLAIVRSPEVAPGRTAVTSGVAVVLLAAFVTIERRSATPLLRLGLLRSAALARANLAALLLVGSFMGFQFVAVLYLQELRGWSAVQTGLALAVIGIDAVLAPTLTPVLVRRFGVRPVIVAGFTFAAAAYALFLPLTGDGSYWLMVPSFLVLGLAFALTYGPLTIAATDDVGDHEQGLASGILTTSFQFGTALGLAVVTAVVVAAGPLSYGALRAGLLVALAAAVAGVVVTASGLREARSRTIGRRGRRASARADGVG